MEQVIYTERQKFNQKWLWAILFVTFAICLGGAAWSMIWNGDPFPLELLVVLPLILILVAVTDLKTTITDREIRTGFWFRTKSYALSEIEEAYVRTYAPVGEYGGWGIKGSRKNRAYNAYGDQGLQLILKDGRKVLVGTQQPDVIEQAMRDALGDGTAPEEELELDPERVRNPNMKLRR